MIFFSDGGLPLGSLCLIEEDVYGSYARIVTKYFLAEGVLKKNFLLSASLNESPWDLVNSLPSPSNEVKEAASILENKEELKIAWRYENLSLEDPPERMGIAFDLSTPYCLTESQKSNVVVFDDSKVSKKELKGTYKNPWGMGFIETVGDAINKWKLDSGSNNLLRIVVSSFGSPYWQFDDAKLSTDFTTTLLLLKALVRSANAVAVVTVPHQLLDDALVGRSRSIADVVLRLKSLREDPYLQDLMDVHGILEMKKMTNLTSLKPLLGQDGTTTYGFKVTKRKFKIEKLHLPPALEQEKSAASGAQSTTGCGSTSSSKSNLDF
nr:EOG090X0ALT [Eurycercus lamellatus]